MSSPKAGHTLQDHQWGQGLAGHVHADGEDADHDHDHDHDDMGSAPGSPDPSLWRQDNVVLHSVGIDIGSSGTQVVFSKVHLQRVSDQLSTRYVVLSREPLYQSPISLTPYLSDTQIDARALGEIIEAAYGACGLHPDEVDAGAVILTGEALRRENGEAIAAMLAEQGGEFVCATAGHHMESMLAVYGSGAARRSFDEGNRILNIDIGGGTTKLGLVDRGELIATAAVHTGGRLLVVDEQGRITRLDPAGRAHARRAGFDWTLGSVVTRAQLAAVAAGMADALVRVLGGRFTREDLADLLLTDPIEDWGTVAGVMFSGGVGEYVYGREPRDFGDLGMLFGQAIRERVDAGALRWPLLPAGECIRATVLGASEYSVQLSGNTTFISSPGRLLPRKNLQVVPLGLALDGPIDRVEVARALTRAFTRHDLVEGEQDVAVSLRWGGPPAFRRLSALALGLVDALSRTVGQDRPLYLVADGDIAQTLGHLLKEDPRVQGEVLVIDGITLWGFDFIDLGRIRMPSNTVPVTIKSLVFSEDPRSHGKSDLQDWHHHGDGTLHRHGPGGHDHHHNDHHDHARDHGHGHAHPHGQGHGHSHAHTHDHSHDHSHGPDGHHHPPPTPTPTTDTMTIDAVPAVQALGPGLLPSLLLVAVMGFRHGFDADHIAVVDGMTRARQLHRSYWSSRLVGLQFAAGHSLMILLASLFFFAHRAVVPPWLDGLGLAVSVVFLLVIAVTNGAHALSDRQAERRPLGPMAALIFRATGGRLHPALVGVAFALSFDSMAQAAFFAARGGELAGLTAVVLMAALFGLGMMVADAVNGGLLAWCAGRSDQAARRASRVSSAFVAFIALATAAAALAREAHAGFADLWEQGGVWVGVSLMVLSLLVYTVLTAVFMARQKARSSATLA